MVIIDVDGVVSPVGDAATAWGDEVVAGDASGPVLVSPTLCARLDELSHRSGVTCVWLSSWSPEMRSHLLPFPGRDWPALPDPTGAQMTVSGWWKFTALDAWLAKQSDVRALAWCDDHLVGDHLAFARRGLRLRGLEPLLMAPRTEVGLTREDMDQLEAWASQPIS